MLEVWSRIVFHDKVCSPYFDDDWIFRLLIIAKGIQEKKKNHPRGDGNKQFFYFGPWWDLNFLGITSLKWKREERYFIDFKITLMLHCGSNNNSNFNNFSVLCCESNAFKLSLRKSILIKRDSLELDRNVSSMPLLLFN